MCKMLRNRFTSFKSSATHIHVTYWAGGVDGQGSKQDLTLSCYPYLYCIGLLSGFGVGTGERACSPGRVVGSVALFSLHAVCRYGFTSSRNAGNTIKINYFVHIKRICIEGLPLTLILTGSRCQPLPRNPKNPIPVLVSHITIAHH